MKRKVLICGVLLWAVLSLCACSGKGEEEGGTFTPIVIISDGAVTEEGEAVNGSEADGGRSGADKRSEDGISELSEEEKNSAEDNLSNTAYSGEEEEANLVGIKAHIKEIHGSELLISSDSDDYPGVFTVTGAEDLPDFSDLQGGTSLLILMQESNEKDEQGNARYKAVELTVLSGDAVEAQEDILLTSVPTFQLQDALSSKMDSISLRSGNYMWNIEEGETGTNEIACGAPPLDEASMDFTVRLKVPEYNRMNGAAYLFSTKVAPDTLTVRRWDASDIGCSDAKEECIIKYYYKSPILTLEAGKVYEFTAEWKKESAGRNKFYGNASYVLVTE